MSIRPTTRGDVVVFSPVVVLYSATVNTVVCGAGVQMCVRPLNVCLRTGLLSLKVHSRTALAATVFQVSRALALTACCLRPAVAGCYSSLFHF